MFLVVIILLFLVARVEVFLFLQCILSCVKRDIFSTENSIHYKRRVDKRIDPLKTRSLSCLTASRRESEVKKDSSIENLYHQTVNEVSDYMILANNPKSDYSFIENRISIFPFLVDSKGNFQHEKFIKLLSILEIKYIVSQRKKYSCVIIESNFSRLGTLGNIVNHLWYNTDRYGILLVYIK